MGRQHDGTGMSRSVRLSIATLVWAAVLSGCAHGALTGTAVQGTSAGAAASSSPTAPLPATVGAPQRTSPATPTARPGRPTPSPGRPSPRPTAARPAATRPESRAEPDVDAQRDTRAQTSPETRTRPAHRRHPQPSQLVAAARRADRRFTARAPASPCVSIAVTGDILLHPELVEQAREDGDGELDFFPMLAAQQPYIQGADLGICHLETPLAPADGPFTGLPGVLGPAAGSRCGQAHRVRRMQHRQQPHPRPGHRRGGPHPGRPGRRRPCPRRLLPHRPGRRHP